MSARVAITTGLSAALVLLALYGIFTVHTFSSVAGDVVKATTTEQHSLVWPTASLVQNFELEDIDLPEPTVTTVTTVSRAPSSTHVEDGYPQPEPFTAEMTAAGIAAADQPIVRGLVLSGSEWSLSMCGCLRLTYATEFNPVGRFRIINHYRASNYNTWSDALAQFNATGRW